MAHEVNTGSITGRMIQLSIEQTKLETAGGGPLFQQSFAECKGHITPTWVTQVWSNAQRFGVSIVETGVSIERQRVGDVFLLDSWRCQGYSSKQKAVLNECRMQLGVVTLADMVTADGTSIMRLAFDGVQAGTQGSSGRPRVPRKLTRKHWLLWQEWIEGLTEGRHLRLRRRMQAWLRDDRGWLWWRRPNDDGVAWQWLDSGFRVWRRTQGRRARRAEFQATNEVSARLPTHARRSSVQCVNPHGVVLAVVETPRIGETVPNTPRDKPDGSNQAWERDQVSGDASDAELRAAIRRGDLMAVSDGSFKRGFGTSAYVLHIMDSGVQRTGCNVVPGAREVQSAYRSELAGVAGVLRELVELERGGDLGPGPVVIGLDGMKAMENSRDGVAHVGRPSFDMLDHIKALRRRLAVAVRFRWVRGHQDDQSEVLDQWALLNVHCDSEAKKYWDKMQHKTPPQWRSDGSFAWKLYVGDMKSSWAAAGIHDAVVGGAVETYWDKKMGRVRQDSGSIEAHGRRSACARASWKQRLFVAKMSTGFIGVGVKLKQYGAEERCPWCGQAESVMHVVRCSASGGGWEECFQQYVEELETIGTSGPLVSLVYSSLRGFCGRAVREGFQEEVPVRWWPVLMGWIPRDWCEQQQRWFVEHGSGRRFYTVESWARDAVLAGWRFVHSMWRCRNQAKRAEAAVLAAMSARREELEEVTERHNGFSGWEGCDLAVAGSGAAPSPLAGADTRRAWLRFVRAVRARAPDNVAVEAADSGGSAVGSNPPDTGGSGEFAWYSREDDGDYRGIVVDDTDAEGAPARAQAACGGLCRAERLRLGMVGD